MKDIEVGSRPVVATVPSILVSLSLVDQISPSVVYEKMIVRIMVKVFKDQKIVEVVTVWGKRRRDN